ncbi:MAG: hypothetical protein ABIP06_08195 [Pyrinomonadaceae bacterium]
MREKIFTVKDTFNITARGIVVTGKLKFDSPDFRIGSEIVLIRPDGRELETEISAIEQIKPITHEDFNRRKIGVIFKGVIKKMMFQSGLKFSYLKVKNQKAVTIAHHGFFPSCAPCSV